VAVAVQLVEAGEAGLDVVERVRALRVPRDLHALVARELRVDLAAQAVGLLLQLRDLALGADAVLAQLLDLLLELQDRLLELQPDRHGPPFAQRTRQLGTRSFNPAMRPSCARTRKRRERIAIREWSGLTMCSTTSDSPG
jgi:hypothetical protein